MQGMSDRATQFRTTISGFIEERRTAKGNDRNYDPAKYDFRAWLIDAARRVAQIQAVTHVLKATHSDAKGSSLHVVPGGLPARSEIGSHILDGQFVEDVVGNAAALDVFKFLKIEVEGRRLLDWMQAGDADLQAALSADKTEAVEWMTAFASLVRHEEVPVSHPLAKQVYWLTGEDPRDDGAYHLLQPMFPSSLVHAVHADIESARFGEINVEARKSFRENKPHEGPCREYRNLAVRKLGGTKPQNISQLNSERRGFNYLLPSLPPQAWVSGGIPILDRESAFGGLLRFGDMRELALELRDFLAGNPDRTAETRSRRTMIEQAIAQELAIFGASVRAQYEAGWTRDSRCVLPLHQQLWLDPDRTNLIVRADPENPEWQFEDEAFNQGYDLGEWADQVAGDFGLWLNAQLRKRSGRLLTLGETEMRHFARQAVLDVAWPVPLQRRAPTGAVV